MDLKGAFKKLVKEGYRTNFSPDGKWVFIFIGFDTFKEIVKDLGIIQLEDGRIEIRRDCADITVRFIANKYLRYIFFNKGNRYEIHVEYDYKIIMRISQYKDKIEISNA